MTTLPAPMTVREPIVTPGQMMAPPPTQTSEPISTGLPNSCVRAQLGVHRMRGGVDLHGRAEQRVVADADLAHVEHDAVEVEEALAAEVDVRAVVAKERRLHPDIVAAGAEQLAQDAPPLGLSASRVALRSWHRSRARSRAATSSGSSGS